MTDDVSIPAPLHTTLHNLAYLSEVQPNQKYFISERCYINANEWSMTRVRRYWKQESLSHQIAIITDIINNAMACIKIYKSNMHYPRLIEEFAKARDGISHVLNTYSLEGTNTTGLKTIKYSMDKQLELINNIEPIVPVITGMRSVPSKPSSRASESPVFNSLQSHKSLFYAPSSEDDEQETD